MFLQWRLAMPSLGRENVRHATLLFCAEGVNVRTKPAQKKARMVMTMIAKDKLCVVQFMHSGNEFLMSKCKHTPSPRKRADGSLLVPWSREENHFRRLVRHNGWYVDKSGNYKHGDLAFWTEWESETMARPLGTDEDFFKAHFAHEVQCPPTVSGTVHCGRNPNGNYGCQNTDPCVFGDTFKYSNCHQSVHGDLRRMKPGSLIVFGSYKKDKRRKKEVFCLDTVFIVGDVAIDYSPNDANGDWCSGQYKNLTLRRLPHEGKYTFYRGATCRETVNLEKALFSFTPAKLCDGVCVPCERCVLDDISGLNKHLRNKVFNKGSQGFHSEEADQNEIKAVWNDIVQQVIKHGFVLGVHFDWPKK